MLSINAPDPPIKWNGEVVVTDAMSRRLFKEELVKTVDPAGPRYSGDGGGMNLMNWIPIAMPTGCIAGGAQWWSAPFHSIKTGK